MARTNKTVQTGTAIVPVEVLPTAQEAALLALVAGSPSSEAAAAAGVQEHEILGWLTRDARFIAELNRRRRNAWEFQRERLRGLAGKAVDTLADLLESGDPALRFKAATVVLKIGALDHVGAPNTDVTPEDVELRLREQEGQRRNRALLASLQ